MDLSEISSTFHPGATEYPFFSNAHEMFFRIDGVLSHKVSLSKRKKCEIITSIFSNHRGLQMEISKQEENWTISKLKQLVSQR